MGRFDGKRGLILGVANDRSIAWGIAKQILDEGGQCGFSHLPDKPDDERKKNRQRVARLIDGNPNARFLAPMNVQEDVDITQFMDRARSEFGQLDFILHSIAFASLDDLKKDTVATSRDGFALAMDISVYSLLAVCHAARELLTPDAAVLTLTYLGGERCIPGYNVMGICKAALDASVRYLAFDLGGQGARINAISAGPLKTLASSAVGAGRMLDLYAGVSPMGRGISPEDVAKTAAFLLSGEASGITGEVVHVDCGYSIMGSPGRLVERMEAER